MLWIITLAGPLSFIALELGWMVTEEGRQPWVIYGWLLTKDAANPAQWLNVSFFIFSFIYLVLGATLIVFLLRLARQPKPEQQWPRQIEVEPGNKQEVGVR